MHAEHLSIHDMPVDERPRERMRRGGAASLSDAELVALLVEPGNRGKSSLAIGRELVADGLLALAGREWIPGKAVGSLGPSRVARIGAALELGRRIATLSTTSASPLADPTAVARRLIATYAYRPQETFGGIYLDARNRIVSEREIYVGTLSSTTVSPRDVFRHAFNDHAAAVIVFHNHPSGDPSPSPQDLTFTVTLTDLGAALGVAVLDHLIVASRLSLQSTYKSFFKSKGTAAQANGFNYTIRLNNQTVSGTNALKINVDAGLAIESSSTIAAESTILLVFDASGVLRKKIDYKLYGHANGNLPPSVTNY